MNYPPHSWLLLDPLKPNATRIPRGHADKPETFTQGPDDRIADRLADFAVVVEVAVIVDSDCRSAEFVWSRYPCDELTSADLFELHLLDNGTSGAFQSNVFVEYWFVRDSADTRTLGVVREDSS